jgi:hypothetical protein
LTSVAAGASIVSSDAGEAVSATQLAEIRRIGELLDAAIACTIASIGVVNCVNINSHGGAGKSMHYEVCVSDMKLVISISIEIEGNSNRGI